MGHNFMIYVPKWYTKIMMNFKAFLEVEVQDKKYKTSGQKWSIFHKYKILSGFHVQGWLRTEIGLIWLTFYFKISSEMVSMDS